MATTRVRIRVAATNSDPNSSCCCVANFPGGLPSSLRPRTRSAPHGDNQSGVARRDVPRLAVRDATPIKKKNGKGFAAEASSTMVVGKDSTCYYAGSVVSPDHSRMCVGVYDKQTSTLTLYPAATTNLQQSVIGYQPTIAPAHDGGSTSTSTTAANTAPAAANNAVTKKMLLEEFGSVKKQRVYKSQEANRVHLENVVGSTVEQFLDRSGGGSRSGANSGTTETAAAATGAPSDPLERATWEWRKSFLPPFDEGATDPLRVYQMEDFAGRDVWRMVGRRASALLKDPDRVRTATATAEPSDFDSNQNSNADSYLPSTLSSLKRLVLQQQGDASTNLYQVKCTLLYQELAVLYLQLHKRPFIPTASPNRNSFFGAPVEVGHLFLDAFATSIQNHGKPGYVMSKANHDKCRIHLLLLHVASHGGSQAPILDASGDVRLDLKDAVHLLRLAGCAVDKKRGATDPRATLSVPLTFPPATGKRKRGGGGRR